MSYEYTVLEIGSGSFKLHKEGHFTHKFQSSLGKGLKGSALDPNSVSIALKSLKEDIIPFLESKNEGLGEVKVFATAAIRSAMKDPNRSGEKFIKELEDCRFQDIRIFSEDEECTYAALGIIDEMLEKHPEIKEFSMLDTGGASHQLVEIDIHNHTENNPTEAIKKKTSIPIGSHTDLNSICMPDFLDLGFSEEKNLVIIGTSGSIICAVPEITIEQLITIHKDLVNADIKSRRDYLTKLIPDTEVHKLFVDYRLEILPNAFAIIINCAQNLGINQLLYSHSQAMNYVSKYGFLNN